MAVLSTWEEAVQCLRRAADQQELVRSCYYDDPLIDAARRFQSSAEWTATRQLLRRQPPAKVLDLGAGRGIVSFAFAQSGFDVTALEPDASPVVGRGAIIDLCSQSGLSIQTSDAHGERLPFADSTFDIVYARAVLHHARNLNQLCHEAARVLRPGGIFLAVREHVITRHADLATFLNLHPLHRLYGGEHAYRRSEYVAAITAADLHLEVVLGPYDSPINYWPLTADEIKRRLSSRIARRLGQRWASWIVDAVWRHRWSRAILSRLNDTPGRHHSFLGIKP